MDSQIYFEIQPYQKQIVIIGAGPSGICCAYGLVNSNLTDVLVLEMGKPIEDRDRYDQSDCIEGEGGAGLFSDGKFSFFPSGTGFWNLKDKDTIEKSYRDLETAFQTIIETEVPPYSITKRPAFQISEEKYSEKFYDSFYLNLDQRKKLVQVMNEKVDIQFNHKVALIQQKSGTNKYLLEVADISKTPESIFQIECEQIILAGGRFFPLIYSQMQLSESIFRRRQLGVRVKGQNGVFEKMKNGSIDPKWMFCPDQGLQFRTFCFCEDGQAICAKFLDYNAYSGRSDCDPSGVTNFGLNLRIKNPDFPFLIESLQKLQPFCIRVKDDSDIEKEVSQYYGPDVGSLFAIALQQLFDQFSIKASDIQLLGPTVQGVGQYPIIDENLKIPDQEIYVLGDSSGIFRGIIPSMLSGFYVSNLLTQAQTKQER